jgi:L-ribulose-5-phosphate 4-epimerase
MNVDDIVILALDGEVVSGDLRPSTDTATHLALYRAFPEIGGVVHTHSTWATAFAQAEQEIPILGTTHADFSPRAIPLARYLSADEITAAYEHNTGVALQELIEARGIDELPAALIRGHGPFVWGADANHALERAVTLEAIAEMAFLTLSLRPDVPALSDDLINKHFKRKHGPDAYYGQQN